MRKFKIKVEGKIYEVEVEEVRENKTSGGIVSAPQPVVTKIKEEVVKPKPAKVPNSPAPSKAPTAAIAGEEVVAPMPGKVLQLRVAEGDSVKEGDPLLILEAMTLENEIVANTSGSIKKINVAVNDMVDTGDVLMLIG
ncbi:MAG TPA: biotin/lipoyl-binding protein [Candidatus Atribacteria bacterium]|nr:biotin/lipoyl-binding protein [Candidatus Atribacteria bacterium]